MLLWRRIIGGDRKVASIINEAPILQGKDKKNTHFYPVITFEVGLTKLDFSPDSLCCRQPVAMTLRFLYLLPDWGFNLWPTRPHWKRIMCQKLIPKNFANKFFYAFPFIMHAHIVIISKIKWSARTLTAKNRPEWHCHLSPKRLVAKDSFLSLKYAKWYGEKDSVSLPRWRWEFQIWLRSIFFAPTFIGEERKCSGETYPLSLL